MYQLEPELQQPPPRPVQAKADSKFIVGCMTLLIAPFLLASVWLLVEAVRLSLGYHDPKNPSATVSGTWATALVCSILTAPFAWMLIGAPLIHRALYVRGRVAPARVVGKTSSRAGRNGPTYYLVFEFQPEAFGLTPGVPLQTQGAVPHADWDAAAVGDTLTVLYNPARPRWCTLYQYGLYRVQ